MNLADLYSAVSEMVEDAHGNGTDPRNIEVKTITDRGSVKAIKGTRPFDVRTSGPVLLTK